MKYPGTLFTALLIFFHSVGFSQPQEKSLSHETKTYGVELATDKPEFAGFWVDSLGKGRKWTNGMEGEGTERTYRATFENEWIRYTNKQTDGSTSFKFEKNDAIAIMPRWDTQPMPSTTQFSAAFPGNLTSWEMQPPFFSDMAFHGLLNELCQMNI